MSFLSRFEPMAGFSNLKLLENLCVAVFGLGGVGSYTAEALTRSGVGHLILIDGDSIEESNINRQLYALYSTIGKSKTQIAKERIADINPLCKVETVDMFVLPDNFSKTVGSDFLKKTDFIVDAVDTLALKIFLAVEAEKNGIPIISAMGCGNRLNADFEFADIYKTKVCPLCKIMRTELKKQNVKALKVLYSKTECSLKQRPPASCAWVPPIAGLLIAGELVKSFLDK